MLMWNFILNYKDSIFFKWSKISATSIFYCCYLLFSSWTPLQDSKVNNLMKTLSKLDNPLQADPLMADYSISSLWNNSNRNISLFVWILTMIVKTSLSSYSFIYKAMLTLWKFVNRMKSIHAICQSKKWNKTLTFYCSLTVHKKVTDSH